MKYDLRKIMVNAWGFKRRNPKDSFSICLKKSWAQAKSKKEFTGYAVIDHGDFNVTVYKLWEKHGMKRIYLNSENRKHTYGYIDCYTKRFVLDRNYSIPSQSTLTRVSEFKEAYNF